jgi:hypothetical protein
MVDVNKKNYVKKLIKQMDVNEKEYAELSFLNESAKYYLKNVIHNQDQLLQALTLYE